MTKDQFDCIIRKLRDLDGTMTIAVILLAFITLNTCS